MKRQITTLEPYSCDSCGRIFGDYDFDRENFVEVSDNLSYWISTNGEIVFEGYLDGDYCTECMDIITDDLYKNGYENSPARDRYDKVDLEMETRLARELYSRRIK